MRKGSVCCSTVLVSNVVEVVNDDDEKSDSFEDLWLEMKLTSENGLKG